MATTAILRESALLQHQIPISKLQCYSNIEPDAPTVISAAPSSDSALTSVSSSKDPSSQGPTHNMTCSLAQSQWHDALSSSSAVPASSYMPLESKQSANHASASQTSPELNLPHPDHQVAEEDR